MKEMRKTLLLATLMIIALIINAQENSFTVSGKFSQFF